MFVCLWSTVKPALSSHFKEDQKLLFETDYCLMQVKSIAECSKGSTVNPVLSSHSKRTQKLVFNIDYRLMQVKSIAECSNGAFCNTFDLH